MEDLLKAFQEAVNEKMKCQAEADATNATIDLANRLVNGLASEKIRYINIIIILILYSISELTSHEYFCVLDGRWSATVVTLKESGVMLPGDVLLATAFISYVGCFTRRYRLLLINDDWVPAIAKTNVSFTQNK